MKYISVCSGIEAASVAWEPLGWSPLSFSEIEPFPSAVLNNHWPNVPNYGDMTKFRDWPEEVFLNADIIVGGPPCQAFSVAGARRGLDDSRGQITIKYIELIEHADFIRKKNGKPPVIVVFENVPGLLSDKTGAFGCFLGALAGEECELQPSGKKWTNAGCVFGPQRAVAWRILDAQYFGVAQRRRRVFVVASARKGFNPTEVLFEFDGVRRDSAPSRSAGQEVADSIRSSFDSSGATVSGKQVFPTLASSMGKKLWLGNQEAFSGDYFIASPQYANGGEVCDTVTRKWAKGSGGPSGNETGNLAIHPQVVHGTQDPIIQPVDNNPKLYDAYQHHGWREGETCGTLTVGQNNTIRGDTPVVIHAVLRAGNGGGAVNPVVNEPVFGIPGNWIGRKPENGGNATEPMDNMAPCQTKTDRHAVAYGIQGSMIGRSDTAGPQGSGVSSNISFTLTKGDKHAVAVTDIAGTMLSRVNSGGWSNSVDHAAAGYMQIGDHGMVRRLTPIECERLQGFPDNWTQIPYRKKPADQCPDGPRYAACGNSMAVPVMRWIGQRIQDHINGKL